MKVFLLLIIGTDQNDVRAFRGPLAAGDAAGKAFGTRATVESLDAAFMWEGEENVEVVDSEGATLGVLMARNVE